MTSTLPASHHAIALDTPEQATRFNRRLINACLRAHTQREALRPGQLDVAIIGAGATGTELAAELHRATRAIVAYGLDRIDPEKDVKITLIEGADRSCRRCRSASPKPQSVFSNNWCTCAQVRAWSRFAATVSCCRTGTSCPLNWWYGPPVKGPAVLAALDGLEVSRNNQLVVTPTLQTTRDPNILAMGDCAHFVPEGAPRPVPPRAQAAHQQASHLVRQMRRRLAGQPLEPWRYRDFGSLVSLGEYSTVGNLMGSLVGGSLFVEGLFARFMYKSLYKMHELALHGAWKVSLDTLARTLMRRTEPTIKLH